MAKRDIGQEILDGKRGSLSHNLPNKAWCVLKSHRLLVGREASPTFETPLRARIQPRISRIRTDLSLSGPTLHCTGARAVCAFRDLCGELRSTLLDFFSFRGRPVCGRTRTGRVHPPTRRR